MIECDRHDRHRNLVVAATGTGTTVVAALDCRQLRGREGDLSLLFVAHPEEILRQTLATYRAVLRRGDFGEIRGLSWKAALHIPRVGVVRRPPGASGPWRSRGVCQSRCRKNSSRSPGVWLRRSAAVVDEFQWSRRRQRRS